MLMRMLDQAQMTEISADWYSGMEPDTPSSWVFFKVEECGVWSSWAPSAQQTESNKTELWYFLPCCLTLLDPGDARCLILTSRYWWCTGGIRLATALYWWVLVFLDVGFHINNIFFLLFIEFSPFQAIKDGFLSFHLYCLMCFCISLSKTAEVGFWRFCLSKIIFLKSDDYTRPLLLVRGLLLLLLLLDYGRMDSLIQTHHNPESSRIIRLEYLCRLCRHLITCIYLLLNPFICSLKPFSASFSGPQLWWDQYLIILPPLHVSRRIRWSALVIPPC